jgi:hypothetical protein
MSEGVGRLLAVVIVVVLIAVTAYLTRRSVRRDQHLKPKIPEGSAPSVTPKAAKPYWLIALAGLAVICAWSLSKYKSPEQIELEREAANREYLRQKAIVDDVRSLVDASRSLGIQDVELRGRALVWDISVNAARVRNNRSEVYDMLPHALQAAQYSNCVHYSFSHSSYSFGGGCRTSYHIAVAYWPEKRAAGMVTVTGPDPPSWIGLSESRGLIDRLRRADYEAIADYIEALRRVQ